MQPKDILAISGKPGLYKVLNTTQRAIVVESMGEGKRSAVPSSARVSSFEDISIFTYDEDLPLSEVLNTLHAHLKGGDAPNSKEPHDTLRSFVTEVVPDLDQERVYHSDLKKLCTWYNELNKLNVLPFVSEEDAIEADAEAEQPMKRLQKGRPRKWLSRKSPRTKRLLKNERFQPKSGRDWSGHHGQWHCPRFCAVGPPGVLD